MPFDVSEETLRAAAASLAVEYGISVRAVVGDFHRHLGRIPRAGRRLIAFLGGTIGNFDPAQRQGFLGDLRGSMGPDEWFLLGTDLVKDPARLVAAYDDARGVTAEFNRNALRVLNRELDADFDVEAFEHVARWNAAESWIEMWLRSTRAQRVRVGGLDLDLDIAEGEEIRTEISRQVHPRRSTRRTGAGRVHRRGDLDRPRRRLPPHPGPPGRLRGGRRQAFQVPQVLPRTYS